MCVCQIQRYLLLIGAEWRTGAVSHEIKNSTRAKRKRKKEDEEKKKEMKKKKRMRGKKWNRLDF